MTETWTEKYRPQTLDEVVGHAAVVRTLKSYVRRQEMPNILLHGEPGVGKTALLTAFGKDFYGLEYFNDNFTEMNSSDDRGVDIVRGPIKSFADFAPDGEYDFKILYLGEIDGLTPDAQNALKRPIETSAHSVRFIADCNDKDGLIPAIRSRFVRIHVPRLTRDEVLTKLEDICEKEELELRPVTVLQVCQSTKGDLRAAIELLQALPHSDGEEITAEFVRQLCPTVSTEKVRNLWNWICAPLQYKVREEAIIECMNESAWDALQILERLYGIVEATEELDLSLKCQMMECIGEYMWRVSRPCNKLIQLRCCIVNLQRILGV